MALHDVTPDDAQVQDGDEWLEADGLGGYASGAIDGVRTRRYHALLLTAATPPTNRFVLVNGVEVWIETPAGRHGLTSQRYLPDTLHPDGAGRITRFQRDPWPTWTYGLPDGTEIMHELFVEPNGGETVLHGAARSEPPGSCRLTVRPLLTGRDHGALHRANDAFRFDAAVTGGAVTWRPYDGVPAATALTNAIYTHDPLWLRNVLYTVERERGLDDSEDVAAPGTFTFDLATGPATMVLRAGDSRAGDAVRHAADLIALERARRSGLGTDLRRSAAAYPVARGGGRTIMAGFPWFTDWGRDTFIAMRGLLLATGRLDEARDVLLGWAEAVNGGMLPNRFPDSGEAPEYNAVDASLWFIVAVHDTSMPAWQPVEPLSASGRAPAADAAEAILDGYRRARVSTSARMRMVCCAPAEEGVQLTWMDAKGRRRRHAAHRQARRDPGAVDQRAPHRGKALVALLGRPGAAARAAFAARFPNPAGGLYDVVDVDRADGSTPPPPNQIFAVGGLPFPLLEGEAARAVRRSRRSASC